MSSPFYLDKRRAMVSIGPVSDKRHCSYKCPFCYVKSEEFQKYEGWDTDRITNWLTSNAAAYDIIYVSGDTDSFAKPRTEKGLKLLDNISFIEKDVLFTTRYVFDDAELHQLKAISDKIVARNGLAIACVSVCQLTNEHLEPHPIQPSAVRISQLGNLKKAGWTPVLSMRPILPQVSVEDYRQILTLSAPYVSHCLISPYYYDPSSTQLKTDEGGEGIQNLFFNTKSSSSWEVLNPSRDRLRVVYDTAAGLNIKVFVNSDELYRSLKENQC